MFFKAPRVAQHAHASLANTPMMSVAALFASSLVSTAVLSDAVSPEVSSLPSPVGSRLDKAFADLMEKECLPGMSSLLCARSS